MDIPFEDPENIEDPAIREILGQYKKAFDAKDFIGQGESLLHLGTLYAIREQFATAITYYNQALMIQKDIGDEQGQSKSLSNIGLAKADLGNYQDAIKYHIKALAISRKLHNRVAETNHLINLAETYEFLKDYQKAISYFEQVQAVYETMDLPHLLRKAKLNWERLMGLQKDKQEADMLDKRSTSSHPTINSKLQLEQTAIDEDTIRERPLNEFNEQPKMKASNLTTMHRLPNEALQTIQKIVRATDEMRETKLNILKREEPLKDAPAEVESTGIIPILEDDILFAETEEGEFGVDTEPAEAQATQQQVDASELNLSDSQDTGEIETLESDSQDEAAIMDNPDLSTNIRMNFIRQAIKDIQYELSIAEAIGDLAKKGDFLLRLATLYMKLHQYDNAIIHYEQAIVLFGVLGKTYFREEAERGILEAREQKWSRN